MDFMNMLWTGFIYLVSALWSLMSIYVLLGIFGFFLYSAKSGNEVKNAELVITSKANNKVRNVLFRCIKWHSKKFPDLKVWVVVDEGSRLNGKLDEFVKKFDNVDLVIVPRDFKSKAINKGRAIQFFIENKVKAEHWYGFIDDDNLILDRKFLREISYYEPKGYSASNGLLIPRRGNSKFTFTADYLRYFDDVSIFRFATGLCKKPLNGFHGELLLVKGEVLQEISFDRKTVTEDFAFARELLRNGKKVWQSETKISILSPHSLKDFIKQRNRWYRGLSSDIRDAPLSMKIFAGLRILVWKIGILGSWAFVFVWPFIGLPLPIILFNSIGASYYFLAYVQGASRLNFFRDRVVCFFVFPMYSVLETLAPHYRPKNNSFNVIEK